jgi:hypothetical protein
MFLRLFNLALWVVMIAGEGGGTVCRYAMEHGLLGASMAVP